MLDKESYCPCTASPGARFVGSIKLDKQRSGGWWGMFGVEEHFAFPDASGCFDSDVYAATAAVVVIVGDVRLLVWRMAMLVQEAVSGVVLIGDEDGGSGSDFSQGRNGEGWVQLACKV